MSPRSTPVTADELVLRARQFYSETVFKKEEDRPPTIFKPDQDGAVWIDFVADLGDGFDATSAVASLLAREALTVGDLNLPRGQLLVMGGDEVYLPERGVFRFDRKCVVDDVAEPLTFRDGYPHLCWTGCGWRRERTCPQTLSA